jgi:hypothetical protein
MRCTTGHSQLLLTQQLHLCHGKCKCVYNWAQPMCPYSTITHVPWQTCVQLGATNDSSLHITCTHVPWQLHMCTCAMAENAPGFSLRCKAALPICGESALPVWRSITGLGSSVLYICMHWLGSSVPHYYWHWLGLYVLYICMHWLGLFVLYMMGSYVLHICVHWLGLFRSVHLHALHDSLPYTRHNTTHMSQHHTHTHTHTHKQTYTCHSIIHTSQHHTHTHTSQHPTNGTTSHTRHDITHTHVTASHKWHNITHTHITTSHTGHGSCTRLLRLCGEAARGHLANDDLSLTGSALVSNVLALTVASVPDTHAMLHFPSSPPASAAAAGVLPAVGLGCEASMPLALAALVRAHKHTYTYTHIHTNVHLNLHSFAHTYTHTRNTHIQTQACLKVVSCLTYAITARWCVCTCVCVVLCACILSQ